MFYFSNINVSEVVTLSCLLLQDILNREKTQEHDETYYLWAIRFFMEFCRLHSGQVDLVR